jgi:CheY-like chemotaxis protein
MGKAACSILIVDDSEDDRYEFRRALLLGSERHYRFTEAASGAEAIHAYRAQTNPAFDCILLDYHLPDYQAPEILAEFGGEANIFCPVLVLTGEDAPTIQGDELFRAGAQDFISKRWINPESLTRAVQNAIDRYHLTRDLRESMARYRSLFENIPVSYAHWRWLDAEQDYHCLAANQLFAEQIGRAATGLRLSELIPRLGQDNPDVLMSMAKVRETGQAQRWECYLTGLGAWVAISAYRPAQNECVTLLDNISERKQAESEPSAI